MNKGLVSRYLRTSSLGTRQSPEAGNYWSSLEPHTLHGVTHRGSQPPTEVLGANSTASQRQTLAACVINCLCSLTKGTHPLQWGSRRGGEWPPQGVPFLPQVQGVPGKELLCLAPKKRYLSKRKLYSSES